MIDIRDIRYNELELIRFWRNTFYKKYFRQHKLITESEQKKWYETTKDYMFAITENDTIIGVCGLCYVDMINRKADLSFYLFETYIDNRIEFALIKLLDYGFYNLGLNKIYADIFKHDIKKYRLFKKMNFNFDGILRENYYRDDKFYDSLVFSLLKKDYLKLN